MYWYLKVLRQYADFNGRARRKEFWMYSLFTVLISLVLSVVDGVLGLEIGGSGLYGGWLGAIYGLVTFIPGVAVSVRRVHDTGRSGWWLLIALIPLIGIIVLLVIECLDGTPGDNRFGPSPKEGDPYGLVVE